MSSSGRYIYYHRRTFSQLEITREEKSLPRRRRREALEAKCEHGIAVNASDLVDDAVAIIRHTLGRTAVLRMKLCVVLLCVWQGMARASWGCLSNLHRVFSPYESQVDHGELEGYQVP